MHLRNAVITTRSLRNEPGQKQGTRTAVASPTASNVYAAVRGRGTTKRKCIIWVLVLLQVCFVGLLWLLQLDTNMIKHNEIPRHKSGKKHDLRGERIDFITKKAQTPNTEKTAKLATILAEEEATAYLKQDFILHKLRLNGTDNEVGVVEDSVENKSSSTRFRWCFREGTLNKSQANKSQQNTGLEEQTAMCPCQTEWHGRDCGQPEIIWRTLLAAQRNTPLQLQEPTIQAPHRLVYMLDGYFFNLDLMELQIRTVLEVVDFFVINISQKKAEPLRIKTIERRLRDILKRGQFLVNHCRRPALSGVTLRGSCSPMQAYSLMKHAIEEGRIKPTKATDIFLYTSDGEILNRKALKFIKYYYDSDMAHGPMTAMRFRLKYVVYGFYWQHPKLTHISGILSSFATLESPGGGNGDPRLLQHRVVETAQIPAIVIGDLNHFGGWFCQYCQQPDEIILELHAAQDATGQQNVQFPNATRNRQIDASYMQKLIAQGQHIDESKQTLLKLRRYTDKYYAPEYAEQCSWKFGNLLVNLYVSLEEDSDDDEGAY